MGDAMKKITMQDIADQVGVSRITVWKAFNKPDQVSDECREQIYKTASDLGYNKAVSGAPAFFSEEKENLTVSVIVSRPDSSIFWTNIIHHIAKELSKHNINLLYTYAPSVYSSTYHLPPILSNGTVDGVIVLNIYDPDLIRMISALPVPKVFYDTVSSVSFSELNGDLVMVEGTGAVKELTMHLIEKGKTKIGFVGDIDYARTNYDRFDGYRQAMLDAGLEINPALSFTGNIAIADYEETLNRFVDTMKTLPDAFVCASDYVANFLYQNLEKKGLSIPDDLMMTGFDCNSEYTSVAGKLTSVQVDTSYLGKRLTRELLQRIQNPADPYETVYLSTTPIYSLSTED